VGNFNIKEFSRYSELMNTINGGVVNTNIEVSHTLNEIVINLNAPGLNPDSYNIVLNNNRLFIYALCQYQERELGISKDEKENTPLMPLFNRVFDVPPFVDPGKISAEAVENRLQVHLPYKDKGDSNPRKIDIRHN
jgi:HSP20 family protein